MHRAWLPWMENPKRPYSNPGTSSQQDKITSLTLEFNWRLWTQSRSTLTVKVTWFEKTEGWHYVKAHTNFIASHYRLHSLPHFLSSRQSAFLKLYIGLAEWDLLILGSPFPCHKQHVKVKINSTQRIHFQTKEEHASSLAVVWTR